MNSEILTGVVLDETLHLSLNEVTHICACDNEMVIELVEEGIITPAGNSPSDWHFSGNTVLRLRTAIRLQRDLHVNLPGVALVIELLNEINELQGRLDVVE